MNEKLKELAEKSGMTDSKYGMFFAKDYASHKADGVDLEKFAELLVRECAKFTDHKEEMFKYFGVKDV